MKSDVENTLPHWPVSSAVLEISDLVRREGHRVYTLGMDEGLYQSMLCGLTLTFARGGVVCAMKAHNLELEVVMHEAPASGEAGVQARKVPVSVRYLRGNEMVLAAWHRHLCAYRASMRSTSVRGNAAA